MSVRVAVAFRESVSTGRRNHAISAAQHVSRADPRWAVAAQVEVRRASPDRRRTPPLSSLLRPGKDTTNRPGGGAWIPEAGPAPPGFSGVLVTCVRRAGFVF